MTVYPVKKPRRKSKAPVRGVARKARVRRSNPARKAREFARAYGSEERVAFVRALPCVVSRKGIANYLCKSPRHNAHIVSGGIGRKADADKIVPACPYHHQMLDEALGRTAFEHIYKLDLDTEAAKTEAAWIAFQQESAT